MFWDRPKDHIWNLICSEILRMCGGCVSWFRSYFSFSLSALWLDSDVCKEAKLSRTEQSHCISNIYNVSGIKFPILSLIPNYCFSFLCFHKKKQLSTLQKQGRNGIRSTRRLPASQPSKQRTKVKSTKNLMDFNVKRNSNGNCKFFSIYFLENRKWNG